jgi:hypothetical protein
MSAPTLTERFQQAADRALQRGPDRDALARELAALEANPPAFVDVHAPAPDGAHVACAACRGAHVEAAEARARYLAHGARVDALRAQLFRLSYGGPAETDHAGRELAAVRREIRRAIDEHERRRWGELDEETDAHGKAVTTWVSPAVLGEVTRDLAALSRTLDDRAGSLIYGTAAEVEAGIVAARRRLAEITARPVRVPIAPEVAQRAAIPRHDPLDDSAGLIPATGPDVSSILGGTVRIKRRGG